MLPESKNKTIKQNTKNTSVSHPGVSSPLPCQAKRRIPDLILDPDSGHRRLGVSLVVFSVLRLSKFCSRHLKQEVCLGRELCGSGRGGFGSVLHIAGHILSLLQHNTALFNQPYHLISLTETLPSIPHCSELNNKPGPFPPMLRVGCTMGRG